MKLSAFVLIFLLFFVVTFAARAQVNEPAVVDLLCPNGETTWLTGAGPPSTAVLAVFRWRPFGGAVSDAAGNWRIPVVMNEPPGIYFIEVQTRAERRPLARFQCFVGLPLGSTPTTPGAAPLPTDATTTAAPATAQPTATTSIATATAVTTPSGSPTPITAAPGTPGTTTPTVTGSITTTATGSMTATVDTTTTATTTSPTPGVGAVQIILIEPADLTVAGELGSAVVRNMSLETVDLTGWTLANSLRTDIGKFTFPSYTLAGRSTVTIHSEIGNDTMNDLYWDQSDPVWRSGDVAVLRNAGGVEIDRITVP